MPAISNITAKGQTTVPREIRVALDSKPGDLIAWEWTRKLRPCAFNLPY